MKVIIYSIIITFVLSLESYGQFSSGSSYTELKSNLLKVNQRVEQNWKKLVQYQSENEWVERHTEYKITGIVYSKGWAGPQVSRSIIISKGDFLTIDKVTISLSLLEKLGLIGGNILLNYHTPLLQSAYGRGKQLGSIRRFKTYKEALLASPFSLLTVPDSPELLENMNKGDIYTTSFNNDIYIKLGGSLSSLIGIKIPKDIPFGPRLKLTYNKSLQVSIEKYDHEHVNITLTNSKSSQSSFGMVFGVLFEDLSQVPVSITIYGQRGLVPYMLKTRKKNIKFTTINFLLNISNESGRDAYKAFVNGDFSVLETLALKDKKAVKIDYRKEGTTKVTERSSGVHLIFLNLKKNRVNEWSKYETIINDKIFNYENGVTEVTRNRKIFSGKEKEKVRFNVLIPMKNTETGLPSKAFILESLISYKDTKTYGREIQRSIRNIKSYDQNISINLTVESKKYYKFFSIQYKTRFSLNAIANFLNCSEECIWTNLAKSFGLTNKTNWQSEESRRLFSQKKHAFKKILEKANHLKSVIKKITTDPSLTTKAKKLIKVLSNKKYGPILHRFLLNASGRENLVTTGQILGKGIY